MLKKSSSTGVWSIVDSSRSDFNMKDALLKANQNDLESGAGTVEIDMLSNGFKYRGSSNVVSSYDHNESGATYIFAAFAETPFKYSLAR